MISLVKEIVGAFKHHSRSLLMFSGIVIAIMLLGSGFLKYRLTDPDFCRHCHFMNPYVRHWESSTHADVDCNQCHEYGVIAFTGSALKYAIGTYDSRPKADVHDESCLSSGCHEGQDIDGKLEYKNGIQFDHGKHVGQELRGGTLRCSSCHNQIVQYDDEASGHMAVNDKTCFVCHFKDAGRGEAITGCNSCHGMPEREVEHDGFTFDHKPYLKHEIECKQCHVKIVNGDGAVGETKCFSCHLERLRQDHTDAELHEIHVTTNGIDCYKCHDDITHGNFSMVSSLEIDCENCHKRQHNRPKQMYMGIGGKDSVDLPSGMFMAQVSCSGCHTHLTPEGEPLADQAKKEATQNSCIVCHGDDYNNMFENWLTGSKKVLSDYRSYLKKAKNDLASIGGKKQLRTAARAALSKAEFNYNFVRDAKLPHNIQYGLQLLNSSANEFEAAMKNINKAYRTPNRGNGLKPENSCLTFCHSSGLMPEEVEYDGSELPHLLHVEDMEVGCESCHSITSHGQTSINEEKCSECH